MIESGHQPGRREREIPFKMDQGRETPESESSGGQVDGRTKPRRNPKTRMGLQNTVKMKKMLLKVLTFLDKFNNI